MSKLTDDYTFDLIVIGGGAAGFFGALRCLELKPNARVLLIEKSSKLLAKVKVSGGGRCNVTHHLFDKKEFSKRYPRGEKHLFRLLHQFGPEETIDWFEKRGVPLIAEADGRMFPESDSSQSIIDCLMNAAEEAGLKINLQESVERIEPLEKGFALHTDKQILHCNNLLIATGGHPKAEGFNWIKSLGVEIIAPVPSLFTFNLPQHPLKELMGLSAQVRIRLEGSKLEETGPLLITHWGFSGPAVLRCSAWGARELEEKGYKTTIRIHWLPELKEDEVREWLSKVRISSAKKLVHTRLFDALPNRLWEALCIKAGIAGDVKWADLSGKAFNALISTLCADAYQVDGKTTFKEEFVTCGGVSLKEIDAMTCMSKRTPGLFFAGEVLDVDGITGGFNFQHAWSSGFVAGSAVAARC
ncbi:MAG: hypothetical protein RLZZ543_1581 [Bacteroidota bacterium]|jgi:predicted Rossmann fold flavoprotein